MLEVMDHTEAKTCKGHWEFAGSEQGVALWKLRLSSQVTLGTHNNPNDVTSISGCCVHCS